MRFMIQRVSQATVDVANQVIGQIDKGFVVFVGVSKEDSTQVADKLIKKLLQLRIFEDEEGKTNLSLTDVNGSLLIVSQFTLYANCKKGNRPSFIDAGAPDLANDLYEYIIAKTKETIANVQSGSFGEDMKVSLVNEGPFTIMLDSDEL